MDTGFGFPMADYLYVVNIGVIGDKKIFSSCGLDGSQSVTANEPQYVTVYAYAVKMDTGFGFPMADYLYVVNIGVIGDKKIFGSCVLDGTQSVTANEPQYVTGYAYVVKM